MYPGDNEHDNLLQTIQRRHDPELAQNDGICRLKAEILDGHNTENMHAQQWDDQNPRDQLEHVIGRQPQCIAPVERGECYQKMQDQRDLQQYFEREKGGPDAAECPAPVFHHLNRMQPKGQICQVHGDKDEHDHARPDHYSEPQFCPPGAGGGGRGHPGIPSCALAASETAWCA